MDKQFLYTWSVTADVTYKDGVDVTANLIVLARSFEEAVQKTEKHIKSEWSTVGGEDGEPVDRIKTEIRKIECGDSIDVE